MGRSVYRGAATSLECTSLRQFYIKSNVVYIRNYALCIYARPPPAMTNRALYSNRYLRSDAAALLLALHATADPQQGSARKAACKCLRPYHLVVPTLLLPHDKRVRRVNIAILDALRRGQVGHVNLAVTGFDDRSSCRFQFAPSALCVASIFKAWCFVSGATLAIVL